LILRGKDKKRNGLLNVLVLIERGFFDWVRVSRRKTSFEKIAMLQLSGPKTDEKIWIEVVPHIGGGCLNQNS
jgi:hypothetical protein